MHPRDFVSRDGIAGPLARVDSCGQAVRVNLHVERVLMRVPGSGPDAQHHRTPETKVVVWQARLEEGRVPGQDPGPIVHPWRTLDFLRRRLDLLPLLSRARVPHAVMLEDESETGIVRPSPGPERMFAEKGFE